MKYCCKSDFSWLPNGDDMQEAMDSMVGNAYLYGRNWIAVKVGDNRNGII